MNSWVVGLHLVFFFCCCSCFSNCDGCLYICIHSCMGRHNLLVETKIIHPGDRNKVGLHDYNYFDRYYNMIIISGNCPCHIKVVVFTEKTYNHDVTTYERHYRSEDHCSATKLHVNAVCYTFGYCAWTYCSFNDTSITCATREQNWRADQTSGVSRRVAFSRSQCENDLR